MSFRLSLVLVGVAALGVPTACDNFTDCATVCQSYAACFDDDYDVAGCRERCAEKSGADNGGEEFTHQVNLCEACIDDQDCVADLFGCGSDCDGIIEE
jgi:hypothetical protein